MKVDLEKINAFLHYGYIPDPEVLLPKSLKLFFQGDLPGNNFISLRDSELIETGRRILKQTFKDEIESYHDKIHIIPLSGGLDSRTILANLIELIKPSSIITVTFGLPGSHNYERARSIAKKVGVKWDNIDLSPGKWKWTTDLLIESAKRIKQPNRLFDAAVNQAIQLRFGKDCIYWSGFMGDSLSRISPLSNQAKTWEQAKNIFAQKNCKWGNYKLTSIDFYAEKCLPERPYLNKEKLDYYSQLNYCIRQQCFTRHIYSPVGYDIRYPFLNAKWLEFILNIPSDNRLHQSLYRKIQYSSWPYLFNEWNSPFRDSSGIKSLLQGRKSFFWKRMIYKQFPKLIRTVGPDIDMNYIDWNHAIYIQNDFINLVLSNLVDLKNREIIYWIDFDKLYQFYRNKKVLLTSELMTLVALEIHLKTTPFFYRFHYDH